MKRCTTTRRVIVHRDVYDRFFAQLVKSFGHIAKAKIGDPLDDKTLVGPLIDEDAFNNMRKALRAAKAEGGEVHYGKRVMADKYPHAFYVEPALVKIAKQTEVVKARNFCADTICNAI